MTVDNLLLKLKEYDKNLLVCVSISFTHADLVSEVLVRSQNNTIILDRRLYDKKTLNIRQLVKYLLELPPNFVVTFRVGIQFRYVESISVWEKYLILY